MNTISCILEKLASDNSRLFKEKILKEEKDNALLKQVFEAAYNPFINYYIRQTPEYIPNGSMMTLVEALDELEKFSSRKLTGNAAVAHYASILRNVDEPEVIEKIIGRDLKVGVGVPTINKIWPGLIPTFEVMLAHQNIDGITFPCYSQCKMDGARAHLHFDGQKVVAFSRNGKEFELHGMLDASAKEMMTAGETWDGEFICIRDGKVLDRKTGNGILTKAIRGTITEEDAKLIHFYVWDNIDFTSTITYDERYGSLENKFKQAFQNQANTKFRLVTNRVCNNLEDIQKHLEEMYEQKQEGLICKNIKSVWQPKRTKDLGKIKAEHEADLIVTDWNEGTPGSKYVGMIGALVCETSDGLLRVNVGSGLTDADRLKTDFFVGKVITVKYNEVILAKESETHSLFLPRFMYVRYDKDVPNALNELAFK